MVKIKEKRYKTTSEHFNQFKEECSYWIEYFGLIDYRINFYHIDDKESLGFLYVNRDRSDRIAGIYLSTDFGTDEPTNFQIRKTAFHEVCELMLIKISDNLPNDRNIDLVHEIIRRLENSVFRNNYYTRFNNAKTKRTIRKHNKSN